MDNGGTYKDSIYTLFSQAEKIRRGIVEDPIVYLVDLLLYQAIQIHASDIHLQPDEVSMVVRYRIDGVLYDQSLIDGEQKNLVLSRLKILANLDIAERRVPQDGKFKIFMHDGVGHDVYESREEREKSSQEKKQQEQKEQNSGLIDFRVSTFPSIFGEKMVIRILNRSHNLLNLDTLGFNSIISQRIHELINQPHGFFLVTGPTGSGKTTTLYAMLSQLNSPERNIVTMEDPVEYDLPGITQSQINIKAGFTFETGLRALLRQDPDIIMIGEIRDKITAQIAIESSLTGHLVLSTLHTNDAPSAITRLIEMGVEPFLINASLSGVLAQRLVRKLCVHCKQQVILDVPTREILARYDISCEILFKPVGCSRCFNLGYSGRVGIFELLSIDDHLRELIIAKESTEKIRLYACNNGMTLLLHDGIEKVQQGVISLEDLLAVVAG